MTQEQSEDVVRRWIAFAEGGFRGSFDEFISTDYVGHLGETRVDRAELERLERAFADAFPDTNHTINEVLSGADRVVVRLTMHATHRGEYQGISPTNRRIEFTAIVIYRIDGGKIAETWGEVDFARLIRQLRA